MELAFLVYVIGMLGGLNSLFVTIAVVAAFVAFVGAIIWVVNDPSTATTEHTLGGKLTKWAILVWFVSATTVVLIPTERVAYTMVGAYAAQTIATDPNTVEIGSKVLKIINQKLDSFIDEGVKAAEPKPSSKTTDGSDSKAEK